LSGRADDISYIWTKEGWLYLAVVIDLFARRVVGWSTSDRLHRDLALAALRKAVVMRRPAAGLVHHSDRGSQYCSVDYQAELKANGILISMSGRGNCYDNAMVETFFKTLKAELVWRTAFETRADATAAIGRYIDGFYNPVRRHSAGMRYMVASNQALAFDASVRQMPYGNDPSVTTMLRYSIGF
jgi:transposase InsO family protein